MGVFDQGAYNDARTRNIADAVKLCVITDIRTVKGKPNEEGKPVRDATWITLSLRETAKDTDGEELPIGFPKDIAFGYYDQDQGEEKMQTVNRMTNQRIRELVVAALDLPQNHKEPHKELLAQGGVECLKGKEVLVAFSVRKGNQNVDEFIKAALAKK
jgi:hypothetical protein